MRLPLCLLSAAAALLAQEEARQGSVELGYRAVSGPAGSSDAYRSIVNLGEGPKLFHLDFSEPHAKNKLFDRLWLRADSWGGEPYNSANFEMSRVNWYRLTASYKNLAQFNRLPSFALGQQALDLRRRNGDVELEFKPRASISPFVAWSAGSGLGSGLTHFVLTGNEYPVAGRLEDRTDLIRGGVRFSTRRAHATIEQGALALERGALEHEDPFLLAVLVVVGADRLAGRQQVDARAGLLGAELRAEAQHPRAEAGRRRRTTAQRQGHAQHTPIQEFELH